MHTMILVIKINRQAGYFNKKRNSSKISFQMAKLAGKKQIVLCIRLVLFKAKNR